MRILSPRWQRIEELPPYWRHVFGLRADAEIDGELRALIAESYRLGC